MSVYVDSTEVGTIEVITTAEATSIIDISKVLPLVTFILVMFVVIALIKAFGRE